MENEIAQGIWIFLGQALLLCVGAFIIHKLLEIKWISNLAEMFLLACWYGAGIILFVTLVNIFKPN